MVTIRQAKFEEIPYFIEMEKSKDTVEFIAHYSLKKHQATFNQPDIIYLAIISREQLVGFIILGLDPDGVSVELRRIVIASKGQGFGQAALTAMEHYGRTTLGRTRVWLDVFEFNHRGRHIYQKQGYVQYKQGDYEGKSLLYYEKTL